jgi:hypothetical protein
VIKALAPDGQFIIHEIDKIRNYWYLDVYICVHVCHQDGTLFWDKISIVHSHVHTYIHWALHINKS